MIHEEDPRFRHLEKKVGLFAGLAILAFFSAVVFIGVQQDLFTQKYKLRFTVEKGTGFSRGMPVKLSGFRIGRVKSIALNENARVDIYLQIDRKYQKWIRADSAVKFVKEGLVGDNIIEVSAGSPGSVMLQDGDTIGYEKTKGLEEVANEIAEKVKPVLIEVREIIGYLNDPDGDIKQSLRNIRAVSGGLQSTPGKADALLASAKDDVHRVADRAVAVLDSTTERVDSLAEPLKRVDRAVGTIEERIPTVLDKIDGAMDHLVTTSREMESASRGALPRVEPLVGRADAVLAGADTAVQTLNDRLPAMLEKVDAALTNVEKVTEDVRKASADAMPALPPLVRKSEDVMEGADTVMNALKETWPLRTHVPVHSDQEFLPGDSHE